MFASAQPAISPQGITSKKVRDFVEKFHLPYEVVATVGLRVAGCEQVEPLGHFDAPDPMNMRIRTIAAAIPKIHQRYLGIFPSLWKSGTKGRKS